MRGRGTRKRATRPRGAHFDSSGAALAELDLNGHVTAVNSAFTALTGLAGRKIVGRDVLEVVHPDDADELRRGKLTTFRSGTITADLRCRVAGGGSRWTRLTIGLGRDTDGGPMFLLATFVDIGDLKSREAALRRAALFDAETGLPLHRLFEDRVSVALRAADRDGEPVLVGVVQVGAAGEMRGAAARLAGEVRASDTIARLGRNELGVLMPGAGLDTFERLVDAAGVGPFGGAAYPADGSTVAELLAAAHDRARRCHDGDMVVTSGEAEDADLAARVQALQPVSVFMSASEAVLARIARYTSRQLTAAGTELPLDRRVPSLHVVEHGLFEVVVDGQETSVMTLAPNDFIGSDDEYEGPALRLRAVADAGLLVLAGEALDLAAPRGSALRSRIRDAVQQRAAQVERFAQRVSLARASGTTRIAVYSTKGGSGGTTFAANLASELGALNPGGVLLVDLALPFNHVALVTNLSPSSCLARLSGLEAWALPGSLRSALVGHPDGFLVLPTALRPEEGDLVTPDLLAAALDHLSGEFEYVLFDIGTALDDRAISALDRADRVVLMATPELTSMHATRTFLEIARGALGIPETAIDVVLNHRAPHSAMDRRAVEEVLGRSITAELGYTGARPERSVLAGALMSRHDQPSPLGAGVRAFAASLARRAQKAG